MGLEFAGIIEEVGSSENGETTTEKWSKGDEVLGYFTVADMPSLWLRTRGC